MKLRRNGASGEIPVATLVQEVQTLIGAEVKRINDLVVPMPLEIYLILVDLAFLLRL